MIKHHSKLTPRERGKIAQLIARGLSLRSVAKELIRSVSTISDEVARNTVWEGGELAYEAITAQSEYEARKSKAGIRQPLKNKPLYSHIIDKLRSGLSPEQITGRLRREYPKDKNWHINYETIYQYIYDPQNQDERLWEYLPRGQKKRRKQKGRRVHKSHIRGRISISKRPMKANNRKEFGHHEGDTVEGLRSVGDGIHTEVERISRMTFALKIPSITSEETVTAQKEIFSQLPHNARRSVTLDNGRENHLHMRLKKELGMKTYFCHPYSSYERGTNENTNGLLRRFLPKGTDFRTISQEDLDEIVWELNNRPRKVLDYQTPLEVFTHYLEKCSE